jgi:hypothetical protein
LVKRQIITLYLILVVIIDPGHCLTDKHTYTRAPDETEAALSR